MGKNVLDLVLQMLSRLALPHCPRICGHFTQYWYSAQRETLGIVQAAASLFDQIRAKNRLFSLAFGT